jgi:Flp pilus assembly protein CpaB
MRRGRILIFLVLIVVIGLALLYFAYTQFGQVVAPPPTQTALTEVFYAAQNIPQGTKITEDLLGTFSIPSDKVADVMFTADEKGALVGQTARFTLDQGVLITAPMVGAGPVEIAGASSSWAVKIPSGMVAATIPTNRLSLVGYGVSDGAHVNLNACILFVDVDPSFQSALPNYVSAMRDVFFPPEDRPIISIDPLTNELPSRQGRTEIDPTFQKPIYTIPSEAQRPRLVCQMILQDVVVLKLGNFSGQATSTDPNATPSAAQVAQAQQQAAPDIVTLMVNPQDSISLNYFVYSGAMLSMSLRNPNDTSRFAAESATLTSLLTQYNIALPSKLPYAMQPRIDVLSAPGLPNDVVTVQPQQ